MLLGVKPGVQQQFGHPDHAIQRSAQLVAHGRDEHRLRVRCLNGLIARDSVLAGQTLDRLPALCRADVEVRERRQQQQHCGHSRDPGPETLTVCKRSVALADLDEHAPEGRGASGQSRLQFGHPEAAGGQTAFAHGCRVDVRHERLDGRELRTGGRQQAGWRPDLRAGSQAARQRRLIAMNPGPACGR